MTKNIVFISQLPGLCCGHVKTCFPHFDTTLTTPPWSWEKIIFHFSTLYATPWQKEKYIQFLLSHNFDFTRSWKKYSFFFSLFVNYAMIQAKNCYFSFHHYLHYTYIFVHYLTSTSYAHCVTNLLKKNLQTLSRKKYAQLKKLSSSGILVESYMIYFPCIKF